MRFRRSGRNYNLSREATLTTLDPRILEIFQHARNKSIKSVSVAGIDGLASAGYVSNGLLIVRN